MTMEILRAHGLRPARHTAPLVLALLAACGPAPEQQDTAPAGTPLRLDDVAAVSIGVAEGDSVYELHDVRTPFVMDGRIVVPQRTARTIRVYDNRGRYVTTLGRRGDGPGEFRDLGSAWARGDTIEAFDGTLLRITRFLPGGGVDIVSLVRPPRSAQSVLPAAIGPGWFVAGVAAARITTRDRLAVHHVDRSGHVSGELAHADGMLRIQTATMTGPAPLTPRAVFRVRDDQLYVAETLTPQIDVYDATGTHVRSVLLDIGPPLQPQAALQRAIEAAPQAVPAAELTTIRASIEAAGAPADISRLWDFHVDARGFLWIRAYDPAAHATPFGGLGRGDYTLATPPGGEWSIHEPDGTRVGTVRIPDDVSPIHIGETSLLGIRYDELGVESVVVHRLTRR